jgi:uncharacterized membrane protein YhaH (DUF805 family)
MFKYYWWFIALFIGMCITFIIGDNIVAPTVASVIACMVFLVDPETTLGGKFDGGFI